ncbi:hypothetical protein EJ02DRAFT_260357 [Clathrospora elynae]|uniref:Uncharacterized protein n=1 Tax=Clathrospora elynae TaxID=706981 RepID=A0A6A5T2A3_9PLEO|nr:hypothetical protein EJ02DRAFT_260357 [Clathrospora elynae]
MQTELTQALSAWSSFFDVPAPAGAAQHEGNDDVRIPPVILALYPAIPPFVRAFLAEARKPPFTFVVPNIQVPIEDFIYRVGAQLQAMYPKSSISTPQHESWTFATFYSSHGAHKASNSLLWMTAINGNRAAPVRGCYIVPGNLYAHASALLLPFSLRKNGCVLQGDWTVVDRTGQGVLYQHGSCNPFMPGGSTPLAVILTNC